MLLDNEELISNCGNPWHVEVLELAVNNGVDPNFYWKHLSYWKNWNSDGTICLVKLFLDYGSDPNHVYYSDAYYESTNPVSVLGDSLGFLIERPSGILFDIHIRENRLDPISKLLADNGACLTKREYNLLEGEIISMRDRDSGLSLEEFQELENVVQEFCTIQP